MGEPEPLPVIVFEDRSLIAVRKPPRMHSVPGQGSGDLCAWVFERFPEVGLAGLDSGSTPRRRPAEGGLLHRLDYETSGLVLFARNASAFASLLGQQERGVFIKRYLAYCAMSGASQPLGSSPGAGFPDGVDEAAWAAAREELDAAALAALLEGAILASGSSVRSSFRAFGRRGANVACMAPGGGGAAVYESSILAAEGRPSTAGRSLGIRVGLARGFRHQVRAHLAWIGLPILGDPLYGGEPDERLRLHAVALTFDHPLTGERLTLTAEP